LKEKYEIICIGLTSEEVQHKGSIEYYFTYEICINIIYNKIKHKLLVTKHYSLNMDSNNEVLVIANNETIYRKNVIRNRNEDIFEEVFEEIFEEKSNVEIINWELVDFEELPFWMKDNDYLRSSYRPPIPSYKACIGSIFRLHNQTTNIWTHLLGAFLFKYISVNEFPDYIKSSEDSLILWIVYSGVILSFYGSTIFHIFLCHSEKTASFVAKIDYCGISIHIFANLIGLSYFTFYCDSAKQLAFILFSTKLCIICLFINCLSIFNSNTSFCRIFRAIIFFLFGFTSIIPQISWFYYNDVQSMSTSLYLILMDVCYTTGVILYATRIPERYFIGKCDLIHSHTWFHIFIIGGSYYCFKAICDMAFHKLKSC
jgi:adiponectin receptor